MGVPQIRGMKEREGRRDSKARKLKRKSKNTTTKRPTLQCFVVTVLISSFFLHRRINLIFQVRRHGIVRCQTTSASGIPEHFAAYTNNVYREGTPRVPGYRPRNETKSNTKHTTETKKESDQQDGIISGTQENTIRSRETY